jgi:hypothetical protein
MMTGSSHFIFINKGIFSCGSKIPAAHVSESPSTWSPDLQDFDLIKTVA